jgi:Heat induced stress protein YflT domain
MATHIDPPDVVERRTVAGLFLDRASAEQAIDALKAAGFTGDQIGVALRDRTAQGVLIEETGTQVAEEAATTGALGGGLLGGLTGLLIGIGALVIPGLGPVVAGGVLAAAFGVAGGTAVAGAGIGAAAGGVLGALAGLGMPDLEARYFETGFRAGRVLVTVEAGARMLEAMAILDRSGADTGPATGPGAIGG